MSSEISTIEESIKIALDAADAATDIIQAISVARKQNPKVSFD